VVAILGLALLLVNDAHLLGIIADLDVRHQPFGSSDHVALGAKQQGIHESRRGFFRGESH